MLLNKDRAIKTMEEKDLDALIASSPVNIQYLSDVPGLSGYAVLPREKNQEPFLITGVFRNAAVLDSNTWIKDIRYCGGTYFL
ncbi:unnamed protein product [marine sediment metagenome]|uniref:Creatinase N-terminal domain-containing protein n=1 Tax=marine sediment metagenome TaxID=412755 RepID=X1CRQ2_9ZZZZ